MTFVGKILVVFIVVFSLFYMGFAIAVFSAHTNWKTVAEERQQEIATLDQQLQGRRDEVTSLQQSLATETDKVQQEKAAIEGELEQRKQELERLTEQVTSETERANMNSRQAETALREAEDRRMESGRLREQIAALLTEKDGLFNKNVDLQTDLFQATTERDRSEKRNQELQVRVRQLETLAANNGLPTEDLDELDLVKAIPLVEGLVLKTAGEDVGDRFVEISIGSDDGLMQGHQLLVWRPGPSPKYLGKIQVIDTDPDRAVARVLSNFRIQEHDNVTSQFK